MLCTLLFRVFSSIMFAAMNVGQSASMAPDYGKARTSAQRIFQLLDRKPLIDSYSEQGEKLVSFGSILHEDLGGYWRCFFGVLAVFFFWKECSLKKCCNKLN